MNLGQLRAEVLARGFDPTVFSTRITQYLNDGQNELARRVDYYIDMATRDFATVQGTSLYAFPTDMARGESLYNTDLQQELTMVGLRDMDRSPNVQGQPSTYAISGANHRLYPTPDGIYNLELRYWKMPAQMVADSDVPSIPSDYHNILVLYATAICYEAEDDPQMGQYWMGRWDKEVSRFAADVKFPSTDSPFVAKGMWDADGDLSSGNRWWLYV